MSKTNWLILGASSPIAKEFINSAAPNCYHFILVGRSQDDINHTAADLEIRHNKSSEILILDLQNDKDLLLLKNKIKNFQHNLSIFIAHTLMYDNNELDKDKISQSIQTNIISSCQIIHSFVNYTPKANSIIYLSSVAGDRGRNSNSLYGATKKAVEVYLDGLKISHPKIFIAIIRLGFIDTSATYGKKGVFLAATAKQCAYFCFKTFITKRNKLYFPWFWRYIMLVIKLIPSKIFNKLKI